MIARALGAALCAAAFALAGCDRLAPNLRSPFHGVDVTGAPIGADFRLLDHTGKPRTLSEFRGKVAVVVFGFTHCPDVCPTTLADFASARKQLGADASRVQVLFVTVDPARDNQEVLGQYVPAFDPTFVGLRGSQDAIDKVTRDFKVYAHRREGKTPGAYTVDHSAQSFAFDPQGKVRLAIGYGMEPAKIASDLRLLMN
jgi:protein SCO1